MLLHKIVAAVVPASVRHKVAVWAVRVTRPYLK